MKLSVQGLALGMGVTWALGMLFWGLLATYAGWGADLYNLMGGVYRGTAATFAGSLLGAVWGFLDGLVCGAVLSWFYNHFSK